MKRLYSYILAGCMLLAACGDDGDGNTGKGPGEN